MTQRKNGFILLVVFSVITLLTVMFIPMFCVGGGLFTIDADYTFFDVVKSLIHGTDFSMWVEAFTWSAFVPAIVLFFSSIAKGKVMSILSSASGVGLLLYNLFRFISQHELSDVFDFDDCSISVGFWIALILLIVCFFRAISIKKLDSVDQAKRKNQSGSAYTKQKLAGSIQLPYISLDSYNLGIPIYHFNGKEYLTIDDEKRYLESANKGVISAQHGLGLFYMQNNNIDQALYWFCVAEYNGVEQATKDLNYIISIYPDNAEWINRRIAYHRSEVEKNPVYKETIEDIIKQMANDPNLRK